VQAKASKEKGQRIVRNLWIALFRGINVGGNNILPMRGLAALLSQLGASDVRTYIQSGNVVFRHSARTAGPLAQRIADAVLEQYQFAPRVLLLTRQQLECAAIANPFAAQCSEPRTVHVMFLAAVPVQADLAALEKVKAAGESFVLAGSCFYIHTPDGLAHSQLAERAERLLGVAGTTRNWRTVGKLLELVRAKQ
jgi:uncharacterized protein (DUF1697 family)